MMPRAVIKDRPRCLAISRIFPLGRIPVLAFVFGCTIVSVHRSLRFGAAPFASQGSHFAKVSGFVKIST